MNDFYQYFSIQLSASASTLCTSSVKPLNGIIPYCTCIFNSLGGLSICCENMGEVSILPLESLFLHNYMTNSAGILYLGFLVRLISQFEKLVQRDLNENLT